MNLMPPRKGNKKMKKLIMGLAAIALAGSLHAATAAWGMDNDGSKTYANATVYMVLNSNFDAAIAALDAGGADVATTIAGYNISDGGAKVLSGKGKGNDVYSSATSGQSYNWILVMSNGATIADGMQYYSTAAISYATMDAAGAIATGAATPSDFKLVDSSTNLFTGTSGTIGAAPEPTSGLLLLLGVAGLALKRKRA